MWIKICGITRIEDAQLVQQLGADTIGFIFAKSPRRVTIEQATEISHKLNGIAKVGVFVNETLETVQETREKVGLDIIQLHGQESPEYCEKLGGTIVKAFRAQDETVLQHIKQYPNCWKYLIDAFVPGEAGGTGKQVDEQILRQIKNPEDIILAGGIRPDNVNSILKIIQPFGIDLSSGVEDSPGTKNHEKLHQLFNTINN